MAGIKEYRNMKVYEQSGYNYKRTPTIMLKGQWLRDLGFEENMPIRVHCEDGVLTITRAEETQVTASTMVAEAEPEYGRKKR